MLLFIYPMIYYYWINGRKEKLICINKDVINTEVLTTLPMYSNRWNVYILFSEQAVYETGASCGQIAKERNCSLEVSSNSSCCFTFIFTNTFGKGMNLVIFPAMGEILSLLFFFKDVFDIN